MPSAKIAISLDSALVDRLGRLVERGVFPSRSRAIQDAVRDRLDRISRDRLARECAKLDREFEMNLAEEDIAIEADQWPTY